MSHAVRLRQGSCAAPRVVAGGPSPVLLAASSGVPAAPALPPGWALPRICGIHNTSAAKAGIAHTASAAGAPTRSASGVTVAAASAAMVIVTTLDRLVAPPTLLGTAWRKIGR